MTRLLKDDDRRVESGTIIAVSYEARKAGVKRNEAGAKMKKLCPELVLVQVPTNNEKADLTIYKEAGQSVVDVLKERLAVVEKRSVDEVAVDLTQEADKLLREREWADLVADARRSSFLADCSESTAAATATRDQVRFGHSGQGQADDGGADERRKRRRVSASDTTWERPGGRASWSLVEQRLVAGAVAVDELRAEVRSRLGYSCSGGIAMTKQVAKLGCGLHKPNKQVSSEVFKHHPTAPPPHHPTTPSPTAPPTPPTPPTHPPTP